MTDERPRVLLVDDDDGIRHVCGDALSYEDYQVTTAASGAEALKLAAEQKFAAAVVDLVLPDADGLTILAALREADPDIVVILMTGFATLENAIEAVRRGAYDFLRKPFGGMDLVRVVQRGLQQRELGVRNRQLLAELDEVNRDLLQKVHVVSEELTAFIRLGRRLGEAEGPLPVLADLIRAACELTTARTGAIFVQAPDGSCECLLADGEAAPDLRQTPLARDEALLTECLRTGQRIIVPQLLTHEYGATGTLALLGLGSAMLLPLTGTSGTMGVLGLFDPLQPFSDRQASLVNVLAAQAAEVVMQARLRSPVQRPVAEEDEFVDLSSLLPKTGQEE